MNTNELTDVINQYRTKANTPMTYGSFKVLKSALARIGKEIGDYEFGVFPTEPVSFRTRVNESALVLAIKKAIDLVKPTSNQVQFDTGLMVLLCLATSLRTSEIMQMTVKDLEQLMVDEDIFIRIKKKIQRPKILIIKNLITPKLEIIRARRVTCLITSASTTCLKEFKKLVNEHNEQPTSRPLGMQAVRSLATTFLTKRGGLVLAQLFNRHDSKSTTSKHYVMYDTP